MRMRCYVQLVLFLQCLGGSGFPLFDVASKADGALQMAMDEINTSLSQRYLYRVFKASVTKVIPLGLNTYDLILAFGIRETDCVKGSGLDPQGCAYRRGFFVHESCPRGDMGLMHRELRSHGEGWTHVLTVRELLNFCAAPNTDCPVICSGSEQLELDLPRGNESPDSGCSIRVRVTDSSTTIQSLKCSQTQSSSSESSEEWQPGYRNPNPARRPVAGTAAPRIDVAPRLGLGRHNDNTQTRGDQFTSYLE